MPQHTIPPIFDKSSKVLILGSFPSVKSREQQFYYGHPQNRFWRVLSDILKSDLPSSTTEKVALLLQNHIALWDVISSCEIDGSDDSSIRDIVPNNLKLITNTADIKRVFTNGEAEDKLYKKYCLSQTGITATRLPSTSPANAGYKLEELIRAWTLLAESLKDTK
ncbi:MAG: DNA-deoxyinosine glycosylase [Oscillospiraceae bacterium]|nr:DNA-deoxyinosine glycosylase [Oscillospiraceae bacterium]